MRCAARVRYIHEPRSNSRFIPDSVFETLRERADGAVLFPRLKHFTWDILSKSDRPINKIPLVLATPAVSAVYICSTYLPKLSSVTLLSETLASLAELLPWLEEVTIGVCRNEDVLFPLLTFHNLHTITFTTLPCQHLLLISALPRLEKLRCGLQIENSHRHINLTGEKPKDPFPTTQTLHLIRWDGTGEIFRTMPESIRYKSILTYLARGSFICVSLPLWVAPSATGMLPILKNFCSPSLSLSLRSLDITVRFAVLSETFIQITFGDAFHPLFHLRELVELKLTTRNYIISMANEDVSHMASAWPSIEVLYMNPQWLTRYRHTSSSDAARFVPPIQPSILALVDLAQRRPRLEVLGITIANVTKAHLDTLTARATTRVHSKGTTQGGAESPSGSASRRETDAHQPWPKLSQLHLSERTRRSAHDLHDVAALARALSAIFPDLEGTGVLEIHERRTLRRRSGLQGFDNLATWSVNCNNHVDIDALMLELDVLQARRRDSGVDDGPRRPVGLESAAWAAAYVEEAIDRVRQYDN